MNQFVVTLPHGTQINGSWVTNVGLRELNGYDEQLLSGMKGYPFPFQTTALLAKIAKFDNNNNINRNDYADVARRLTVGDRIALLLHLRRIAFGNTLACVLSCPKCSEKMSLDLQVLDLIQPSVSEPRSEYVTGVDGFKLKIRPVTGADLESLFYYGNKDDDKNKKQFKAERLVRSCIVSSDPVLPDRLDDDLVSAISAKLEEVDLQAVTILDLVCPECKHKFQTVFNAEDFVYSELGAREERIEKDIHWLAFNYHWSEDSILSLSIRKRKRYVDLINKTLAGEGV